MNTHALQSPPPAPAQALAATDLSHAYSEAADDPAWDTFLRSTPLGRFEQSSLWARVKAVDGWKPARVVLAEDGAVVGGLQLLWRRSRLGRIGYISKGPVWSDQSSSSSGREAAQTCSVTEAAARSIKEEPASADDNSGIEALFANLIVRVATMLHLRALIVQPPEFSDALSRALSARGFLPNYLSDLINATLEVNLADGMAMVEKNLSRTTRQKVRQSAERGVRIRDGDDRDIDRFFQLMLSTCQRQQTKPNPAKPNAFRSLWNEFNPSSGVRFSFAEHNGETLCGLVSIAFGNRVTFWKRGWASRCGNLHPNELLMFDALKRAESQGYGIADFGALDRDIAETLLNGKPLSEEQQKSRHFFHLGFGGHPRLLPASLVYLPNPICRFIYRKSLSIPPLKKAAEGLFR